MDVFTDVLIGIILPNFPMIISSWFDPLLANSAGLGSRQDSLGRELQFPRKQPALLREMGGAQCECDPIYPWLVFWMSWEILFLAAFRY